jgi:hypothetical protein
VTRLEFGDGRWTRIEATRKPIATASTVLRLHVNGHAKAYSHSKLRRRFPRVQLHHGNDPQACWC